MMYPFLTLEDDTEFVRSDELEDGRTMIYVERPDAQMGFLSATCFLPEYDWENVAVLRKRKLLGSKRS